MLYELVGTFEPAYRHEWEDLSAKYREHMLGQIVGFEIAVTKIEGKFKLSQNRVKEDQANVIASLGKLKRLSDFRRSPHDERTRPRKTQEERDRIERMGRALHPADFNHEQEKVLNKSIAKRNKNSGGPSPPSGRGALGGIA